jgi:hypothetical protein
VDQELIAYLDERFRETAQQSVDLRREIDERFRETAQQFADLRKEMDERFKEVNETTRQTLILVEDLRDEVHLVAEAFLGTDERVTRLEKSEALAFERVQGMVEPYFKSIEERGRELDARSVETDVPVKDLQNRVGILETRATREDRKVMEAVAERLAGGKRSQPPSPTR